MKTEIVKEYGELSKVDIYRMTSSSYPKTGFKDFIGTPFRIDRACMFKDVEKDKVITSLIVVDGQESCMILSGDSKTVQDSFEELCETFGDELGEYDVILNANVSKNNRTFITLCLA